MFFRMLQVSILIVCLIAFVGCEGDRGPVGPEGPAGADGDVGPAGPAGEDGDSFILAYGDIDVPSFVESSGPAGVTVSMANPQQGTFVITVTGSFPAATGVLMVSIASNQDTNPNEFIAGTIDSWTTTEIVFTVLTVDQNLSPWNEDFSFMLLGQ